MSDRRWQFIIERAIEDARKQGKFDNLPGEGKPLELEQNPYEDPTWRTAYRMLKNNDFTLPWIEARQEIDARWDKAKTRLVRGWLWYTKQREVDGDTVWLRREWRRMENEFRVEIDEINEKIRMYNLQTPSTRFEKIRINADVVLEAVQQENPQ
jgi:DnaJ family protein C protein 28